MTKINGFFETFLDSELHEKLQSRSKVIRVHCLVRFKTESGFTEPYPAIIDTGAHTSLLPLKIWKSAKHRILGQHYVKGLVPGAQLDVQIGEVTAILADVLNTSREHTFLCFFSPHDTTPLILGFKEFLSKFRLVVEYSQNTIWLEEE